MKQTDLERRLQRLQETFEDERFPGLVQIVSRIQQEQFQQKRERNFFTRWRAFFAQARHLL